MNESDPRSNITRYNNIREKKLRVSDWLKTSAFFTSREYIVVIFLNSESTFFPLDMLKKKKTVFYSPHSTVQLSRNTQNHIL